VHPVFLGQVAHDHVRSLIHEADSARLARAAAAARPSLRRRAGLRLIAAGEWLAPERPRSVAHFRGGRA
jgi:hypothetical protein